LRQLISNCLNAIEKAGFEVLSAHRFEDFGNLDVSGQYFDVTKRDHNWMTEADIFIPILPNDLENKIIRTDGTCVEIGWASAMKKPIVLIRCLDSEHSHLIKGIDAVTNVIEIDLVELENSDCPNVIQAIRLLLDG
jgi:nucleoside 2-deoxyribosyltransferase